MRGYHTWGVFELRILKPLRLLSHHKSKLMAELRILKPLRLLSHHKSKLMAERSANYYGGLRDFGRVYVKRVKEVKSFSRI